MNKNKEKKFVQRKDTPNIEYLFYDGYTINEFISKIKENTSNYDPNKTIIRLYHDDYDNRYTSVFLEYQELETDKEFEARIRLEEKVELKQKKEKEARKTKEIKEYERLKKKYG